MPSAQSLWLQASLSRKSRNFMHYCAVHLFQWPIPADRVGTFKLGLASNIGAGRKEHRPNPSPERSCSRELPAERTSGRPRAIPMTDIL